MRASLRVYRWLLRLYPPAFRETYAEPLERQFRDELAESKGLAGLVALWARLLFDLAVSVPAQFGREIMQDSRHALRQWAARPLHTGFAIAALAIGIGANTGVFSVVNALLLRALPFRDPSRLAALAAFPTPHDSPQQFHDWWMSSTYLDDAALVEPGDVNLVGANEASRAHVAEVSWNFFAVLGAQPALGRGFAPGEDTPGHNGVAVIAYGLWEQLFGGDRRAVGSTIQTDGIPLTIVGVAPPGFDFPGNTVLWRPARNFTHGNNGWLTIARLKAGIGWPPARAAFAADAEHLAPHRPKADRMAHPPLMIPLQQALSSSPGAPPHSPPSAESASLILMAGALAILLIACTNLANLLLARTAGRATEFSIRSAVGASRARLTQQLLTESVLLSLVAAAAGLVVAYWTTVIATRIQPAPIAAEAYTILDFRVLGFAIAIAVLCGLLFGVLPALQAGRAHTFASRGSLTRPGARVVREALVALQVMLTIVLLACSLSLRGAFVHMMGMDRGFDRQGVATVGLSVSGTREQGGRALAYLQDVVRRVEELPGVRAASATEFLPLAETGFIGAPFSLDGRPASEFSMIVPVLPDYVRTLGGRILYGREFSDREVESDAQVAVVNEQFAREFGNPGDVVGHQLRLGNGPPRVVVGVAKDIVYLGDYNHLQVFFPDHAPGGFAVTLVVRVAGRAEDRLATIRDAVKSVDPEVPVFDVKTMDDRLAEAAARPKFYSTALLLFAAFALLLAVIGIYGAVSYAAVQRTHESGVRMALGATPGRLRGTMLAQGLIAVAAGAVLGAAGAIQSGELLIRLIDGAQPIGADICAAAVLCIAFTAATANWIATRRISRLDIMDVLRAE